MRVIDTPKVRLIARPQIDAEAIYMYLMEIHGLDWMRNVFEDAVAGTLDPTKHTDAEVLIEFCGRLCYRSWAPGLNVNVTRVRTESADYLRNILGVGHGSVLEHANFSFVLQDVSRVFTHEQVRHRIGTAFSQESMRFVRLTDIPFWFPEWAQEDPELMERGGALLNELEAFQLWMARHFGLDDEGVDFSEKKAKTSFMRRFAPDGVATSMVLSANIRAIRHMIEMRTDPGAEEEIRLVYNLIGNEMIREAPLLFGDYTVTEDGDWQTDWRKV